MWLRAGSLAAFWIWPITAISAPVGTVAAGFETHTQVFEGTFSSHPTSPLTGAVITIQRRHLNASECTPCQLIPDPPAFVAIKQVVKDEPGHPLHDAIEQRDWGSPPAPPEGTRVRVFSQGKFWTVICPLEGGMPSPPSCERSNQQLAAWQSTQVQIRALADEGSADALLLLANTLAKTDPFSAVRALYAAMDHGALALAGRRASEILVAQANYTESLAVLNRIIASQGAAADADIVARREFIQAVSGRKFDASKVDFSHSTLRDVHVGPAVLRDRIFDGLDWRDVDFDHVDVSGLRSDGFKINHGVLDHVSLQGARVAVAPPVSDGGGRAGHMLIVGPDWDGKSPTPTLRDVVHNAQGSAITAFALQLTRPALSIHASIADSDFSDATLPHAEINGSWGDFIFPGEASTQRTTFDGSDLEAAGIGGHLKHVSFKGAKLDWADFSTATLDDVSFENASLAGAEFAVVQLRNVDFSRAKRWQPDQSVEDVANRLNTKTIIDSILGLRFNPETFGRSTYDCATKWPAGFNPTLYGLIPIQRTCASRQALNFDTLTLNSLEIEPGQDLSDASFRGGKVVVHCRRGSLRGADFTNAQLLGSTSGCDLSNALFDHAVVSASLSGADLDGAQFVDAIIDINAVASFPFGGFWTEKPPDPASRTFTDLPGASFVRSRIRCMIPNHDTVAMFHDGSDEQAIAALRRLAARGLIIDESCHEVFRSL